jgi:nicotinamidase-related amidase
METNNKSCILIVDMINDFVTGKFGSEKAVQAVKLAGYTLNKVKGAFPVIFAGDAHIKNDPEFKVWGEHAIDGTYGSEIVEPLSGFPDYIIKKRHYDAFYDTGLDSLLRSLNIENIYIFGISTDICVEHTCAGAFYRYYNATVISDLCSCMDESKQISSINNIKINYGYTHITAEELIRGI